MEHLESFTTNELQLVVTARKIRQFKEIIAQQRALGASDGYLQPSITMLDCLEQDFQQLSLALLTHNPQ
jgi:hypothetical protein